MPLPPPDGRARAPASSFGDLIATLALVMPVIIPPPEAKSSAAPVAPCLPLRPMPSHRSHRCAVARSMLRLAIQADSAHRSWTDTYTPPTCPAQTHTAAPSPDKPPAPSSPPPHPDSPSTPPQQATPQHQHTTTLTEPSRRSLAQIPPAVSLFQCVSFHNRAPKAPRAARAKPLEPAEHDARLKKQRAEDRVRGSSSKIEIRVRRSKIEIRVRDRSRPLPFGRSPNLGGAAGAQPAGRAPPEKVGIPPALSVNHHHSRRPAPGHPAHAVPAFGQRGIGPGEHFLGVERRQVDATAAFWVAPVVVPVGGVNGVRAAEVLGPRHRGVNQIAPGASMVARSRI